MSMASVRVETGAMPLPMVPGTHRGMLQHGKLVLVVAEVVEQAQDQARGDFFPARSGSMMSEAR